jgi:di/tripeptidase
MPLDSEIIEYTKKAYTNKGLSLAFAKTLCGSDAQAFTDRGFSAVKVKIGMQNVHSKNEKIEVKDLISSFEHALSIIEYKIKEGC